MADLHQYTVKELRKLASNRNIANRSKLKRKAELIAALEAAGEQATRPSTAGRATLPAAPVVTRSPDSSSSPKPQQRPADTAPAPESGLPIPPSYGQDRLVLLPQDPNHLFAYWELSGQALDGARRELGEHGTAVLILHGAGGSEQRTIDLLGGSYYLTVAADASYEAELALRASDGRLVSVVRSRAVRTPADRPAESTGGTWMAVDDHFEELLTLSGLPQGASERLGDHELQRRLWQETGIVNWSSGAPSSGALSSWSSSSWSR